METFLVLFRESKANVLPPNTTFDMRIEFEECSQSPFGPIYDLSDKELEILREYKMQPGFIHSSQMHSFCEKE